MLNQKRRKQENWKTFSKQLFLPPETYAKKIYKLEALFPIKPPYNTIHIAQNCGHCWKCYTHNECFYLKEEKQFLLNHSMTLIWCSSFGRLSRAQRKGYIFHVSNIWPGGAFQSGSFHFFSKAAARIRFFLARKLLSERVASIGTLENYKWFSQDLGKWGSFGF